MPSNADQFDRISPAYAAALKAHNLAIHEFEAVRALFRAGKATERAFADAFAVKKAADAAFDVAFAEEAARLPA